MDKQQQIEYVNQLVIQYQNNEIDITEINHQLENMIYKQSWIVSNQLNIPIEDCKQEAYIILVNSLNRYDVTKNRHFAGYFVHELKYRLIEVCRRQSSQVYTPYYTQQNRQSLSNYTIQQLDVNCISIGQPISEDGGSVGDIIPGTYTKPFEENGTFGYIYHHQIAKNIKWGNTKFFERNKLVFELYHGIGYGGDRLTMREIGVLTGTSKQYISQVLYMCNQKVKEYVLNDEELSEILKELY